MKVLVSGLRVEEHPVSRCEGMAPGYGHLYRVILSFHQMHLYPPELKITWGELESTFHHKFVPKMKYAIKKELKRLEGSSSLHHQVVWCRILTWFQNCFFLQVK